MSSSWRILRILEHLGSVESPQTQSEVAAAVGIARTTVADILGDLRELGYVAAPDRRYVPGPAFLSLAQTVTGRSTLMVRLRPLLERVAAETGETTMASVVSGAGASSLGELFTVDWVESRHPIRYVARAGPHHMYPSAAGKVFLAVSGQDPGAFPEEWLRRRTRKTIVGPKAIARDLARVREEGYAVNDGETVEGLTAIAAPVFDAAGSIATAVTVVGPSERVGDPAERLWPVLRDALAAFHGPGRRDGRPPARRRPSG